jgi:hypothetical protein
MSADRESVHVLPTAWFRNTWSWERFTADAESSEPNYGFSYSLISRWYSHLPRIGAP